MSSTLRLLCLAATTLILLTPPAGAADLEVVVTGLRQPNGSIRIAVWSTSESFLKDSLRAGAVPIPAGATSVRLRLPDVPAEQVAASAYQDLNGNQQLDTGFAGIPKEPYGFSRGARGRFGPPAFKEAAVKVTEPVTTIEIRLE